MGVIANSIPTLIQSEQDMTTEFNVDPHILYPTSPYCQSTGTIDNVRDGDTFEIEAAMRFETRASIKVIDGVLELGQPILADVYKPLGRCVYLVDRTLYALFGQRLKAYFAYHDIPLIVLEYRAWEEDKNLRTVQRILEDFRRLGVGRNEPVLVMGGGVIADIGGLACAMYNRYPPYVMLCTSIVSGIDAGPSPRTCCDAGNHKNLYGAYQAPVLTLTDRTFFATLPTGCLRHGVAEILKMAIMRDFELFVLLEEHGTELIRTKFATVGRADDKAFINVCNRIISLSLLRYIEAEYVNLFETHQMRPHAYGHTWSPGFELPTGLLHGHAVSIGMAFGATLAHRVDWIDSQQRDRIIRLCGLLELATHHPVLDDTEMIWRCQQSMIQKRGGHLCAPLPMNAIGWDGYLNEVPKNLLGETLALHQKIGTGLPRGGAQGNRMKLLFN
uniref:3-dehydroquinate synthase n=1 Tax=Candidatus Kentrum sp. LPFa TaxID=2126335 RepID=A0A450XA66_9GAMM|nr:MAG: 3-dehydroquinate synthase [Candidatus Kentron sp. LPFa]VFK26158.1 MAG: 3-dehydroquinate synthase [Candidatus Kentron sp. LPFa]